jgi:hypothetical protein
MELQKEATNTPGLCVFLLTNGLNIIADFCSTLAINRLLLA